MANEFFKITPENHAEVFDKWLTLTPDEIKAVSAAKSRIYVSVADIEQIQNAFEITLQIAENLVDGLNKNDERRIMQMGYALEDIKQKLIRDIEKGKKKNAGS
jgi:hypothetical protein